MKLHQECYNALRVPTEREHKNTKEALPLIKEKILVWLMGIVGSVIFVILGLVMGLESGSAGYTFLEKFFLLFASGFLLYLFRETTFFYNDFKLVKAIEKGEHRVAKGKCYKVKQHYNVFHVYGVVGNTERPNIVFYVDCDTIEAMTGEGWDFMLMSAGKAATVVMEAPDGKIFVDDRVQNMATCRHSYKED